MSLKDVRSMYGTAVVTIDQQSPTADVSLVAAVTDRRIIVDQITINWDPHAATCFFESGTATKITPTFDLLAAGGTFTIYDCSVATAVGAALTFTSAGASSKVSVMIRYHVE